MRHKSSGGQVSVQNDVHIGKVIRNAVVFNFKNWPGDALNADTLRLT
jgi:hypothetical protein